MAEISDEQLRKEFKRLDKDNDGTITIEELKQYYIPMQEMLGIAPQLVEQEIRGLIKRLDVNNDGVISFEGKNNFPILFIYHIFFIFSSEFKQFITKT